MLAQLDGSLWLMASLLYGSGLRLMECLRLRVKDIDFALNQIIVRDGKGGRDRITVLAGFGKGADGVSLLNNDGGLLSILLPEGENPLDGGLGGCDCARTPSRVKP